MKNTGTWDSDLVLLFMFAFLLPIFLSILANVFRSFASLSHCENVSPDVARLDNPSLEIIQAELKAIKSKLHSGASRPKPKLKPQKKPKPKPRPERKSVPHKNSRRKTVINPKEKEMQQEASNALNTLGIPKSRANSIVKDLCKEKVYSSSEDLIRDAIVYI